MLNQWWDFPNELKVMFEGGKYTLSIQDDLDEWLKMLPTEFRTGYSHVRYVED